jgi:predicted kinase
MMGLSRSGKSTIAKQLSQKKGWPIVNRDSIRLALHGQRYYAPAEPMVKATAHIMVQSLFNAGHNHVIVDETSIRVETRKYWGSNALTPWATKVLYVDTSAEVCLERARAMNDEQIIPVIEKMAADIEPLTDDEWAITLEEALEL